MIKRIEIPEGFEIVYNRKVKLPETFWELMERFPEQRELHYDDITSVELREFLDGKKMLLEYEGEEVYVSGRWQYPGKTFRGILNELRDWQAEGVFFHVDNQILSLINLEVLAANVHS